MATRPRLDDETRATLTRLLEQTEARLERLTRSITRAERERDALARALLS